MPQQRRPRTYVKPMPANPQQHFSYTDVAMLSRYVTEQGSILPRSRTSLTQKQQRRLARAIKHARHLALLPFTQTL